MVLLYCPAFLRGGNNDPASTFVLDSMGARELIAIPGTCLYIYGTAEGLKVLPVGFIWGKIRYQSGGDCGVSLNWGTTTM